MNNVVYGEKINDRADNFIDIDLITNNGFFYSNGKANVDIYRDKFANESFKSQVTKTSDSAAA